MQVMDALQANNHLDFQSRRWSRINSFVKHVCHNEGQKNYRRVENGLMSAVIKKIILFKEKVCKRYCM